MLVQVVVFIVCACVLVGFVGCPINAESFHTSGGIPPISTIEFDRKHCVPVPPSTQTCNDENDDTYKFRIHHHHHTKTPRTTPRTTTITTTTTTMALIEEIVDDTSSAPPASEERLLDAQEIEQVAKTLERPTARMQLEALAKKLRKESAALKALEASSSSSSSNAGTGNVSSSKTPPPAAPKTPSPTPTPAPVKAAPAAGSGLYKTIDRFAFDAGTSSDKFVTLYIPLMGVGSIPKDQITCDFTTDSFDLIVRDHLDGKSYRIKKDSLEHDIVVEQSKFIVKADKILVKLAKVKGEYGSYDYWSKLSDPKRKTKKFKKSSSGSSSDPASSINDMMREMYENGDDQMRKVIGETMLKQQRGELGKDAGMGGMGGLGDMGDFGAGLDDV